MDKKGIGIYLAVTFGFAYILQIGAYVFFTQQFPRSVDTWQSLVGLWVLLQIPAVGALVAARITGDKVFPKIRYWPSPFKAVIVVVLAVPVVFAIIYSLTAVAGLATVDSGLETMRQRVELSGLEVPEDTWNSLTYSVLGIETPRRYVLWFLGLLASAFSGPAFFAFLCFGGEVGWRGYLLPKLMPLGRLRAYALVGLFWGLFFAPLVMAGYQVMGHAPLLRVCALAVALSVIAGELWRRTENIVITAILCGCFYAQAEGIWHYLFPTANATVGRSAGLFAIVVWGAVAALLWCYGDFLKAPTAKKKGKRS